MAAASRQLTPVTLELGGKCPAVFDTISNSFERKVHFLYQVHITLYIQIQLFTPFFSIKYQVAVQRVLGAKFSACAGQACIGVDYILTEKTFGSTLVMSL